MRLYSERDLIPDVSLDTYKADPNLCGLCFVQGVEKVEFRYFGHEQLEQCSLANWLKEAIESSAEGEKDEAGIIWLPELLL